MDMRKQFPSRFFKAEDFDSDGLLYTIGQVMMEQIMAEFKPVMYFKGQKRGLVLNQSNAMAIAKFPGFGPESNHWTGKQIALFSYHAMFQNKPQIRVGVRLPDGKTKLAEPDKITDYEEEAIKKEEQLSDPIPF